MNFSRFVIPGLTRNPSFFWIPAFAGMTCFAVIHDPAYDPVEMTLYTLLIRLPLCFHMKHHRRKGDAKGYCRLLAIENTGIAMPAFLRIPNLGDFFSGCSSKDIRRTNIGTNPTGITFFFVDVRWHNSSFLNEPLRYALCSMHHATFIHAWFLEATGQALERSLPARWR